MIGTVRPITSLVITPPVPDILLSGHHANIEKWRLRKRLEKTLSNRPDLLDNASLDEATGKLLEEILAEKENNN